MNCCFGEGVPPFWEYKAPGRAGLCEKGNTGTKGHLLRGLGEEKGNVAARKNSLNGCFKLAYDNRSRAAFS